MGHRSNAIGERAVVAWRAPPRVRDEGYACASRGALTRPRDGERRKYPSARTSVTRRLASGDGRSVATHARARGCGTGRRFLEGGPARCGMRAIRAATHGPLADHVPNCAGDHARGGLPSAAAAVRADTSGGRRAECVELWSGTGRARLPGACPRHVRPPDGLRAFPCTAMRLPPVRLLCAPQVTCVVVSASVRRGLWSVACYGTVPGRRCSSALHGTRCDG